MNPAAFLTRKWRLSGRGNLYLHLQGITVVVFKGYLGPWYCQVAGEYSAHGFPTEREAKLAAFEAFQAAVTRRAHRATAEHTRASELPRSGRRLRGAEALGRDGGDLVAFGAKLRRYLSELGPPAGKV